MTTEIHRRFLQGISDIFAFVRSEEANKAVAAVTVEDLIQEQIKRNGESSLSNQSQYNPYEFDPSQAVPATSIPLDRANFLGGSDVNLPTRMDRLVALENVIDKLIDDLKEIPPEDLVDPLDEKAQAGDSITTADEFEEFG